MPMKVVFRVDASQKMGSGHVMRCISLAEVLTELSHEVVFVSIDFVGSLIQELSIRGFEVWPLSAIAHDLSVPNWNWQRDADDTLNLLRVNSYQADWIVVDHYQLDGRWQKAIAQCGARIAVLDDLANRPHYCDLLVDQNAITTVHERYDGLTSKNCRRLLGPGYTLLRREFSQVSGLRMSRQKWLEQQGCIVVFMGGADSENNTLRVLESLNAQDIPYPLHVLAGVMNPWRYELQTWCQVRGADFTVAHRHMGSLLVEARAAIVACGMFAVELQALDIPCLLTPLSGIQQEVAEYFVKHGRARILPVESLNSLGHVTTALNDLLRLSWIPSGYGVVPLDGARRIVGVMEEILYERH